MSSNSCNYRTKSTFGSHQRWVQVLISICFNSLINTADDFYFTSLVCLNVLYKLRRVWGKITLSFSHYLVHLGTSAKGSFELPAALKNINLWLLWSKNGLNYVENKSHILESRCQIQFYIFIKCCKCYQVKSAFLLTQKLTLAQIDLFNILTIY